MYVNNHDSTAYASTFAWGLAFHPLHHLASWEQESCQPCAPDIVSLDPTITSTITDTHIIPPKVNPPTRLFNLFNLLGRQLEFPKLVIPLDPLFILGRSDGDNTVLDSPPEQDRRFVCTVLLCELGEYRLERSARVSEEWSQWTVGFGDDAVFGVNVENRL